MLLLQFLQENIFKVAFSVFEHLAEQYFIKHPEIPFKCLLILFFAGKKVSPQT